MGRAGTQRGDAEDHPVPRWSLRLFDLPPPQLRSDHSRQSSSRVEKVLTRLLVEAAQASSVVLFGHLLLDLLQEFLVGRGRLGPILHQVLEERRLG